MDFFREQTFSALAHTARVAGPPPEGTSVALLTTKMLRISLEEAADATKQTVLRLEGQITGLWVEELRRVTLGALGTNGSGALRLSLDLAGVSFVGADGIALFRELATSRVHFTHCSIFIAEQLKGVAHVDR